MSDSSGSSSSDEEEEAGSRFVKKWINKKYKYLGLTAGFSDLNDAFRYNYGKRATGLKQALQDCVENGLLEKPRGTGRSQVFTVAGAPLEVTAASWVITQAPSLNSSRDRIATTPDIPKVDSNETTVKHDSASKESEESASVDNNGKEKGGDTKKDAKVTAKNKEKKIEKAKKTKKDKKEKKNESNDCASSSDAEPNPKRKKKAKTSKQEKEHSEDETEKSVKKKDKVTDKDKMTKDGDKKPKENGKGKRKEKENDHKRTDTKRALFTGDDETGLPPKKRARDNGKPKESEEDASNSDVRPQKKKKASTDKKSKRQKSTKLDAEEEEERTKPSKPVKDAKKKPKKAKDTEGNGEASAACGKTTSSPKKQFKKTILWAKVLSYPWWPARIADPRNEKVPAALLDHESKTKNTRLVQFYGTLDYLWVPRNGLRDFRVNYKQFSQDIPPEHAADLEPAIEDAYDDYVEKYGSLEDGDTSCETCKSPDDADRMLLCDKCNSGFHIYCLNPPMAEKDIPSTNWYCDRCINAETDIDARGFVSSSNIAPGTVGLLNLGSTCYINSFIQCLNSATGFRKALVQNMPQIELPAATAKSPRRPGTKVAESDSEEETSGESETEGKETDKTSDKKSGKKSDKKSDKKKKGKKERSTAKENTTDANPEKFEQPQESTKSATSEDANSPTPSGSSALTSQPITIGKRIDFVLALQAVFHSIWQGGGVDRSFLHALRLASGQALDFKYFRNEHQDINEFLMQGLEYIHTNHSHSPVLATENGKVKSVSRHQEQALGRWNDHLATKSSVVTDNFEGMITRARTCPKYVKKMP